MRWTRIDQMRGFVWVTAIALAAFPVAAKEHNDLRVATWGGPYSAAQNAVLFDSFASAYPDIEIHVDRITEQTMSALTGGDDKPAHDLVAVTSGQAATLCAKERVVPVDPEAHFARSAATTNVADFAEALTSPCFIPQLAVSHVLTYKPATAGSSRPVSACALFDPVIYPGKRALPDTARHTLEWALYCDGVSWEDVPERLLTPDGRNAALEKLSQIRDQVIWWRDPAALVDILRSSDVSFAAGPNGRFFEVVARDDGINFVWPSQIIDFEGWVVPKGLSAAREARALAFVAHATRPELMADLAQYLPFGPARQSALMRVGTHKRLGIDMSEYLPNAPENIRAATLSQPQWWRENGDKIEASFRTWRDRNP